MASGNRNYIDMIDRDMLRELVPVRAWASDPDDQFFLLDEGGIGFGYLCQPLTGADTAASDRLGVLLTQDWPKGTLMQIGLWAGPDIKATLHQITELRGIRPTTAEPTPSQSTILSRRSFLDAHTDKAIIPSANTRVRNIELFVTVALPGDGNEAPSEKTMERARELRKSVQQTLQTAGMAPLTLDAQRYLRIIQTMLNPGEGAAWRDTHIPEWDLHKEIKDQVMDFDHRLSVDMGGIDVDGGEAGASKRITTMSIKRLPRRVSFGAALRYLGDPIKGARGIRDTMLATATLIFLDPDKMNTRLENQKQWATQQAGGPLARFNPRLTEKKECYDALFDALAEGDRPVKMSLSFTLYSDPDQAWEAVSNARTYFRESGFTLMQDRFVALPTFLMSLPLCGDHDALKRMMRLHTMATRHAVALLPLFGDWKGNGRPMLNFTSRNGQLMNYDLFYEGGGNYNALVCAQSGSGKSVLMNELIASYLSSGARAWVIDVGKSYKKLCENFQGQFIEFSDQANICLNPFPIIRDMSDEAEVLVGIIEAMAAPRDGLSDFQRSQLQKALKVLWSEKGTSSTIDDLQDKLLNEEDRRINDIGHQLYPFTSKGPYGHFFVGENNVSFDNSLVVLELEELKSRQHLQQVVLMMLMYQIQQGMFMSGTEQQKLLMVDEGWDLLTSGDTGKFMENSYRRVRKNNGSAIVATQGLLDLNDSSGGRAIKENSASIMLLGMKAETVSALKEAKALDLTEFGFNVLKTVHTQPGSYSEIFIYTDVGSGVGRLVLEPFKQLMYSTAPRDIQAISEKQRQGMTLEQAIHAILQERSSNASRAA